MSGKDKSRRAFLKGAAAGAGAVAANAVVPAAPANAAEPMPMSMPASGAARRVFQC